MPSSALSTLLARAERDDNVVGLVVHGSRGRGLHVTEQSDLDVILVVRELRGEYPGGHGDPVDVAEVTSIERLPEWMLPAVTWAEPALDKTGEVAEQLKRATAVDPATAAEPLDGYINMYYRSAKNARVGLELASLLDAQESIPWYLQFVFNVQARIRPYNKWLEWELREHPLPTSCNVQLSLLERIARTGDVGAQQQLFRDVERVAREHGHGDVVDGWEPDVAWLRGGV